MGEEKITRRTVLRGIIATGAVFPSALAAGTPEQRLEDIIQVKGVYSKPEVFDYDKSPEDQLQYLGSTVPSTQGNYVVKTSKGFFDVDVKEGSFEFTHPKKVRSVYELT
ncbi:MAG: hypothetical protein ACLFPL_00305 [Candidatus Nanoarchaeia archaeon]